MIRTLDFRKNLLLVPLARLLRDSSSNSLYEPKRVKIFQRLQNIIPIDVFEIKVNLTLSLHDSNFRVENDEIAVRINPK